jgi:hypothetical protein
LTRAIACLGLVLGVVACGDGRATLEVPSDLTRIVAEPGRFAGVASINGGSIIVGLSGQPGKSDQLATVDTADGHLSVLTLPERPECRRTDYQRPHRLPDGRLGAVRGCVPIDAGSDQLVAITLDPLAVEVLADPRNAVANVAWDPDLTRAMVDAGSDLCSGLGTVSPDGVLEPIELAVRGNSESFKMSDALESASTSEACESTGWARWPTISLEGTLAFFASTEAAGEEGPARADSPAELYVAAPEDESVEPILGNVVRPRSLQWSPDGQWLAFGGTIEGVAGLWLFEPANQRLMKVAAGLVAWIAWKWDGEGLLAIGPSEGGNPDLLELVEVTWPGEAIKGG